MGRTNVPIGRPLKWWQALAVLVGVLAFWLAVGIGALLFLQTTFA